MEEKKKKEFSLWDVDLGLGNIQEKPKKEEVEEVEEDEYEEDVDELEVKE